MPSIRRITVSAAMASSGKSLSVRIGALTGVQKIYTASLRAVTGKEKQRDIRLVCFGFKVAQRA